MRMGESGSMPTMTEPSNPASGWYRDPDDPAAVRWWDGSDWSELTQAAPAPPKRSRRVLKVLLTLLVVAAFVAAAWVYLGPRLRSADATAPAPSPAPVARVCADTVDALTADGTAAAVVARLQSVAGGGDVDLAGASGFFAAVGEQAGPVLDSTGAECLQAVKAGQAPAGYATFIAAFTLALGDGVAVVTSVVGENAVLPADQAAKLRQDAQELAAAQALVATAAPTLPAAPPVG